MRKAFFLIRNRLHSQPSGDIRAHALKHRAGGDMLFLFLNGRSTAGIVADARKAFGEDIEILVVARDGDALAAPEGLSTTPVSRFEPIEGTSYTLVANGGTSAQLVPVLLRLERSTSQYRVVDLQRDGVIVLD